MLTYATYYGFHGPITPVVFEVAIHSRLMAGNGKVVYESLSARSELPIANVVFEISFLIFFSTFFLGVRFSQRFFWVGVV